MNESAFFFFFATATLVTLVMLADTSHLSCGGSFASLGTSDISVIDSRILIDVWTPQTKQIKMKMATITHCKMLLSTLCHNESSRLIAHTSTKGREQDSHSLPSLSSKTACEETRATSQAPEFMRVHKLGMASSKCSGRPPP